MTRLLMIVSLLATSSACIRSDQLRRRQYDADYQTALHLCGQPQAAFQSGYNAGYVGKRMYSDWGAMCVPEVRGTTVAAYQDGFTKGAANAPIRVIVPVVPVRSATPAAECTFDSDCGGDGYHCRDHTCMGYGLTGDRCVFNDDCSSDHCFGGTCHED
jgi:hypothetical protein